jgi:type IV pilus assembly protein PilM
VNAQLEMILQKIGLVQGVGPARLKPRHPAVAVTVLPGRVAAVRLGPVPKAKKDRRPLVTAYKEAPLPAGTVVPSLTRANFSDAAPVEQAIRTVLHGVAPREDRVCLVLPDSVARVSILRFNRMPATRREVVDLIRFRMQKVLPFKVEEAALDYQLLSDPATLEPDFLVTLAQRTVLFQYERLLTGTGRLPGLVDLESFNLVNLLARSAGHGELEKADWALVNAAPGYLTVIFFRNGSLCFYRSKALAEEERASGDRLVVALRRELASCAAFYREHLSGSSLKHAVLRSSNGESGSLSGLVQEELSCPVQALDAGQAVALPPGCDGSEPRWQGLAPALGAALGRRP